MSIASRVREIGFTFLVLAVALSCASESPAPQGDGPSKSGDRSTTTAGTEPVRTTTTMEREGILWAEDGLSGSCTAAGEWLVLVEEGGMYLPGPNAYSSPLSYDRPDMPIGMQVNEEGIEWEVPPTAPVAVAWDVDGEVTATVTAGDLSAGAGSVSGGLGTGEGFVSAQGVDAEGSPWVVFRSVTKVEGAGLDPDKALWTFTATNMADGTSWQVDATLGADVVLGEESKPFYPVGVTEDVLIVTGGPSEQGEVVGLSLEDGGERWRLSSNGAAVVTGLVMWTSYNDAGQLVSLVDPNSGQVSGTVQLGWGDGIERIYPVGDQRWMLEGNHNSLLVDASGAVLWQSDSYEAGYDGAGQSGFSLADPELGLYVTSGGDGLAVHKASDGSQLWRLDAGRAEDLSLQVSAIGGGYLTVSTDNGPVVLDALTGEELWTTSGSAPSFSAVGAETELVDDVMLVCGLYVSDLRGSSGPGSANAAVAVERPPLGFLGGEPVYAPE